MSEIISTTSMFDFVAHLSSSSASNIHNVWRKVVSSIRTSKDDENNEKHIPIGERLASNTRVIDLKNGVLLIETDHSGWIQYLKIYQKYILNGLKMNLPDLEIKGLAFRLKGTSFGLSDNYDASLEKAQEKMKNDWSKQEEVINKTMGSEKDKKTSELPPELLEKFESIKQSIKDSSQEG